MITTRKIGSDNNYCKYNTGNDYNCYAFVYMMYIYV